MDSSEFAKHARTVHFAMLALCATLLVISQREGPGQYVRAKKDFETLVASMGISFEHASAKAFVESEFSRARGSSVTIAPNATLIVTRLTTPSNTIEIDCYPMSVPDDRRPRFSAYKSTKSDRLPQEYLGLVQSEFGLLRDGRAIVVTPTRLDQYHNIYNARLFSFGQPLPERPAQTLDLKRIWNDLEGWAIHAPGAFYKQVRVIYGSETSYDLEQNAQMIPGDGSATMAIEGVLHKCTRMYQPSPRDRYQWGVGAVESEAEKGKKVVDRRMVMIVDIDRGQPKANMRLAMVVDTTPTPISFRRHLISNGPGIGIWSEESFDQVFPDLAEVSKHLGSVSIAEFRSYLAQQIAKERGETTVFGVTAPTSLIGTLGLPLLVLVQGYFWLNLRSLLTKRRLGADDKAWESAPWIALSGDTASKAAFLLSAAVIPLAVTTYLGLKNYLVKPDSAEMAVLVICAAISLVFSALTGLAIRTIWDRHATAAENSLQRRRSI